MPALLALVMQEAFTVGTSRGPSVRLHVKCVRPQRINQMQGRAVVFLVLTPARRAPSGPLVLIVVNALKGPIGVMRRLEWRALLTRVYSIALNVQEAQSV